MGCTVVNCLVFCAWYQILQIEGHAPVGAPVPTSGDKVMTDAYREVQAGLDVLKSVSQVRVAFAALHYERSCARENVSVKDMPVMRRQEGSGGYPSPEAQQIERILDAGTSQLNLATWLNNANRRAR